MNAIPPFKRRETTFVGGEDTRGNHVPAQTVKIGKCRDEDEDLWQCWTADGTQHVFDGCELSPHPEAEETNVEFVTRMMEWGQGGAMLQAFILQAIEQQAKATLAVPAADLDTGFISGEAWRSCAAEALGWLVARDYSRKAKQTA